jgi:hypothetical protein
MHEVAMATGTSYRTPGTLPPLTSGFVGREAELSRVRGLLRRSRLVTITGAGGVGKTRLALRAAADAAGFPDGVHLIELSGVRDPGLLERTAWLFGASAPLWERTGRWYTGSPVYEALHQAAERVARGGLGDDRFWRLRAAGAAAPRDDAVARALSDTGTFGEPA